MKAVDSRLIKDSGLFDPEWYVARYPDVALSGMSPLEHFVEVGIWLERDPGPHFDSCEYRRKHELKSPSQIPLMHFLSMDGKQYLRSATPPSESPQVDHSTKGPLHGYIDFPLEGDFVGHDYIRVIGWCYLHGREIKSIHGEIQGVEGVTPMRFGVMRSDVANVFPDLEFHNVGFQGDLYPWNDGTGELELSITAIATDGMIHLMNRKLKIDPTVKGPVLNRHVANAGVSQTINDEPLALT